MTLSEVLQAASNAAAQNVSGPVDLLTLLLQKGGVPVPSNAVGSTQWMREKGLYRDVDDTASRLTGETLGILGPMVAAAKAPQIARGLLAAQENAAVPRQLGTQRGVVKFPELLESSKAHFGTTYNPRETGYVLDDGTRLDLSGRHYATGYEKTSSGKYMPKAGERDYLRNSRNVDHRELGELVSGGGWDALSAFMDKTGAVRYMPDVGVSVLDTNMPSRRQIETIVRDFRMSGTPLVVDVDALADGSNVASQEFVKPFTDQVMEFIKKHQKR